MSRSPFVPGMLFFLSMGKTVLTVAWLGSRVVARTCANSLVMVFRASVPLSPISLRMLVFVARPYFLPHSVFDRVLFVPSVPYTIVAR